MLCSHIIHQNEKNVQFHLNDYILFCQSERKLSRLNKLKQNPLDRNVKFMYNSFQPSERLGIIDRYKLTVRRLKT